MFSCVGAAVLLFIASGAARYSPAFGWLPQTLFFLILSGLVILIVKRAARLNVLNPAIAEILEIRLTGLIAKEKNDTAGINPGVYPLPETGEKEPVT
jgi:membrane protein implicated in regulation of membrane protease activity